MNILARKIPYPRQHERVGLELGRCFAPPGSAIQLKQDYLYRIELRRVAKHGMSWHGMAWHGFGSKGWLVWCRFEFGTSTLHLHSQTGSWLFVTWLVILPYLSRPFLNVVQIKLPFQQTIRTALHANTSDGLQLITRCRGRGCA